MVEPELSTQHDALVALKDKNVSIGERTYSIHSYGFHQIENIQHTFARLPFSSGNTIFQSGQSSVLF